MAVSHWLPDNRETSIAAGCERRVCENVQVCCDVAVTRSSYHSDVSVTPLHPAMRVAVSASGSGPVLFRRPPRRLAS